MSITRKRSAFNEECVVSFESEGDDQVYLHLCGITRCLPHYRIARTDSNLTVFEYILKGSGTCRINGCEFHPRAGDVYIAPFGSTHEYWTDPRNRWEKVWFNFFGSLAPELLSRYGLRETYFLPQAPVGAVFIDCLAEMQRHPKNARETATMVLMRLVYHLGNLIREEAAATVAPAAEAIRDYLDNHLTGSVTIEELAVLTGYSKSQVTRLFQESFGESPYQYFIGRKLELARSMLIHSGQSIKAIAYDLGFCDAYYFSRLFKRKFGSSPQAFQRHSSLISSA